LLWQVDHTRRDADAAEKRMRFGDFACRGPLRAGLAECRYGFAALNVSLQAVAKRGRIGERVGAGLLAILLRNPGDRRQRDGLLARWSKRGQAGSSSRRDD
jgi:hypothetical protein